MGMELIFEVRVGEDGGYCARALGHAIFTEAETWDELRANVLEAVLLHFEDGAANPRIVQLHYVKDELIPVEAAWPRPFPGAGWPVRCASDRSCAGKRPESARRGDCREPAAIEWTPQPMPLNLVLGGGEVTETADDHAGHLRREFTQQMLGTGDQRPRYHSSSSGGPLITCRTSIGMFIGTPPGPGAADARAAIS